MKNFEHYLKHFRWLKTKEISTYLCTFRPGQFVPVQGILYMPPSTNIEERNRAKTQSAVVFILLTQASVHENFWYVYSYRRRSKMCAAVYKRFSSSARRKLISFSVGILHKNASVKMCHSFFNNGISIKLSSLPYCQMSFQSSKNAQNIYFAA